MGRDYCIWGEKMQTRQETERRVNKKAHTIITPFSYVVQDFWCLWIGHFFVLHENDRQILIMICLAI